jgi:cytoskeletal protein RodZ
MVSVAVALRARPRRAVRNDTFHRAMILRERRPWVSCGLLALLTACSALAMLAMAEGARAEKAATSPATTSTPHATGTPRPTPTPRPATKQHSATATTRSAATRHSSATTPHRTATAALHSTATAPQPTSKSGLPQNDTKAARRIPASTVGSKGWPTSAVVTVAVLGAALLGVAATALRLNRRHQARRV